MPVISAEAKLDAFREVAKRQGDASIWTPETIEAYKAIRSELDPLRTVDLAGYLRIAPFVGGLYYLAALAIQYFLPQIFPAVYVFLALLFAAPFLFTFFIA